MIITTTIEVPDHNYDLACALASCLGNCEAAVVSGPITRYALEIKADQSVFTQEQYSAFSTLLNTDQS